jgi:hypothetical protein
MIHALQAYPDQVWYDPGRPQWIIPGVVPFPYAIDTPTESAKKYATLMTGNPATASGGDQASSTQPQDNTATYATIAVAALFAVSVLIWSIKR